MPEAREIFINGRFLGRRPTGVDRFAFELLRALDELLEAEPALRRQWRLRILVPQGVTASFRHLELSSCGHRQGLAWEQFELPLAARGKPLLSLCNAAPLFKRQQIVTIHDAAPAEVPGSYSRSFRLWYGLLMPWLGYIAPRVLSVSQFSARAIARAYRVAPAKIRVLAESGEHMLRVAPDSALLARQDLLARPYVLAVSSMVPHKGFATLVQAVEMLGTECGFDVVIAGGTDPRIFAGASLPGFVHHVGYVTDGELRALYEHAACFVFPSYYEGFGLPAAEAMSLGCPVLAADAASIPEVCGSAARYFPATDASALAALLQRSLQDSAWLASARQQSLAQAGRWRWADAAHQLLEALT